MPTIDAPAAAPAAIIAPARAGSAERTVEIAGLSIEVFTYRPAGCRIAGLLVVFHGITRNADDYRDHAKPIADRLCLVIAAPRFDERRFPSWRYQHGGVVDHGELTSPSTWTVNLIEPLVAVLQQSEATTGLPYYLIGHSAGAQFLGRMAAYSSSMAARIVIANPSTYVLPSTEGPPPYGFRGLKDGSGLLRAYLARPITLLLGDEDTGSKNLAEGAAADRQGVTRIDRGRRTFAAARAIAATRGWSFGWTLMEVPGVGHNARSMFAGKEAARAVLDGAITAP